VVCRVVLTCHSLEDTDYDDLGDERPCQRCIKRGLQDACQDGVRKKAKYLHDAPNEALMPGVGGNLFNHPAARRNEFINQNNGHPPSASPQDQFFQQQQTYNGFQSSQQMPPPALQDGNIVNGAFVGQSPVDTSFSMSAPAPLPHPSLSQSRSHSNSSH